MRHDAKLPLAAVFLVIGAGYLQGRLSGRWSSGGELDDAVARMNRVPMTIGDWEGSDQRFDARTKSQAELAGGLMRSYRNRRSGAAVTLLLVCGRPGPISVHTPDVCFQGAGYVLLGAPTPVDGPPDRASSAQPSRFFSARFRRPTAIATDPLRVLWAWNGGAGWEAPENPRLVFAGRQALFKLYAVGAAVSPGAEPAPDEPCLVFLRELLPALQPDPAVPLGGDS